MSTAIYFLLKGRGSLALASGRRGGSLALVRGRGAGRSQSSENGKYRRQPISPGGPTWPVANGRRRRCRRTPGSRPHSLGAWTLAGCTVAPGFAVLRLRAGAAGVRAGLGRELIKLEVVARSWASSLLQTSEAATSAGSSTVMLAAVISSTQPFLADGVRSVQNMELMQDFGLSHQRPHTAIGHSTRDRRKLHTTADNTLTVA